MLSSPCMRDLDVCKTGITIVAIKVVAIAIVDKVYEWKYRNRRGERKKERKKKREEEKEKTKRETRLKEMDRRRWEKGKERKGKGLTYTRKYNNSTKEKHGVVNTVFFCLFAFVARENLHNFYNMNDKEIASKIGKKSIMMEYERQELVNLRRANRISDLANRVY